MFFMYRLFFIDVSYISRYPDAMKKENSFGALHTAIS